MFRATFGEPLHAGPLLRALLPPRVVAAVDWKTLARAPDDLIDAQQREQRTDRLFTVQLARRPAFLYLLLEHKSRPDKWTALQVLAFLVGLWKHQRGQEPRVRALAPILPVVVHFGRGRWRASTDILSLVDLDRLPPRVRADVAARMPDFSFVPHDFAARSAAEVRAMALTLQGMWAVVALQFLAPFGDDAKAFAAALADWSDVISRIMFAPTGREAWAAVTSYILKVTKLRRQRLLTVIEEQIGAPAMKKFVSTYDQILREGKAEGRAEGKAEGKAEGRAEGKAEGKAELVLRQLHKRFGPVPAAVERRIRAAAIHDLDRWAERILDAPSLQDVFAAG